MNGSKLRSVSLSTFPSSLVTVSTISVRLLGTFLLNSTLRLSTSTSRPVFTWIGTLSTLTSSFIAFSIFLSLIIHLVSSPKSLNLIATPLRFPAKFSSERSGTAENLWIFFSRLLRWFSSASVWISLVINLTSPFSITSIMPSSLSFWILSPLAVMFLSIK